VRGGHPLSASLGRLTLVVLCAVLLVGTAGAADSHAYKLGGKKWPVRTITYHVAAPQWEDAIKAGVRTWNNSGVNIKFKRTRSKSRARLRIEYDQARGTASGYAVLGYWRKRWVTKMFHQGVPIYGDVRCGQRLYDGRRVTCRRELEMPRVWLAKRNSQALGDPMWSYYAPQTVVHELGHVIGLQHETRVCAIMWPGGGRPGSNPCGEPAEGLFRCRLIEADDVKGAIRRYGGRMATLPSPELCPYPEDPPAPGPDPAPAPPPADDTPNPEPRQPR
jgi:hypothetical protein